MEIYSFELPNGFTLMGKNYRKGTAKCLGSADLGYMRNQKQVKDDVAAGWSPVDVIVRRNLVSFESDNDTLDARAVLDKVYNEYLRIEDALFLAIEARKYGISDLYSFAVKCPECSDTDLRPQIKLSDLELELCAKDFLFKTEYTLPVISTYGEDLQMNITFRPLLAKDGTALRGLEGDDRELAEAKLQLLKINGEPVPADLELSAKKLLAISHTMEQVSSGYNFMIDYEHKPAYCKKTVTFPLRIDPRDFLHPGKDSGLKTGLAKPHRKNGGGESNSAGSAQESTSKT